MRSAAADVHARSADLWRDAVAEAQQGVHEFSGDAVISAGEAAGGESGERLEEMIASLPRCGRIISKYVGRVAKRTVLSDNALSVLVAVLFSAPTAWPYRSRTKSAPTG